MPFQAFHHVGLLGNGPTGKAGLPFVQSSDNFHSLFREGD